MNKILNMKTFFWGYIVGFLMIIIGFGSITNFTDSINRYKVFENFQNNKSNDSLRNKSLYSENNYSLLKKSDKKKPDSYDFISKWIKRFGYVGLIVSLLYISAGILLFLKKKFSIKFAFVVLGLSILITVSQHLVISYGSSSITLYGFYNIFGVFIDLILFITILVSDKSSYR